jgi:hypothetical protein
MANNYSITFKSLRAGTVYTVNIGGGTGTAVPLKGGAQPFTTQEDDSEDMFTPVRTQSGYIRIVDDGLAADGVTAFDWKDLIPATDTSRPVTLSHVENNTTVVDWQGYMQAQTFSGVLYGNPQEREFPVQCPLSVLGGFDIETNVTELKNFAYLLRSIFSKLVHSQFYFYHFQGGDDVQAWLLKKIDWQNFLGEDGNNVVTSEYDCYTLLEDVCKFFGWTCRVQGTTVYFMMPEQQLHVCSFRYDDLNDLATGHDAHEETYSLTVKQLSTFESTNNDEIVVPGVHKATVNADIHKVDDIFGIPMDEIKELFRGASVSHVQQGDYHHFEVEEYPTEYSNGFVDIDCYRGVFKATEDYEGDISELHRYDFNYYLDAFGGESGLNNYIIRITSKTAHSYQHGAITINGEYIRPDSDTSFFLYCYLRIGSKCWDGSSWVTQDSIFYLGMSGGKVGDDRSLNSIYGDYTGKHIPVPAAGIGGYMDFRILGVETYATEQNTAYITNLTFGFVLLNSHAENNDNTQNVYTAINDGKFDDNVAVDLIFASYNNNSFGLGIIMNEDGSYCETLSYGENGSGISAHPEQYLADRIAQRGATSHAAVSVEVTDDGYTPEQYMVIGSKNMYPVAISHDWRDDVAILKMVEI